MSSSAAAAKGRMNIGEVIARLGDDFAGISISKIRFLEAEGLIDPERTSAGYRKFSHGDVERLRYILRMQRDHYLPLKVIREHLDAIDRGLEPPAIEPVGPVVPNVALAGDGLPSAESFKQRSDLRLSRRELVKVAEIDEALLLQLEAYGLITSGRKGEFTAEDLVVARTSAELAAYGLEPRHLRAFRTAADREVGLVQQAVAPLRGGRDAAARGRTEEAMAEIAALAVKLHATLVKIGLQ